MKYPLSPDETRDALRLGFARAFAEANVLPSAAESLLSHGKLATEIVPAGPLGWIHGGIDLAKGTALGALVAGGAIGAASGHLRSQVEQKLDGTEDPEVTTLRRKIDGYKKMTAELATARGAGLTQ